MDDMKTLIVKSKPCGGCSAYASFYRITRNGKRVGCKVWDYKSAANMNMCRQKKAHAGKVGPRVLSNVMLIKDKRGNEIGYGFLTEIAKVRDSYTYTVEQEERLQAKFKKVFGFEHCDFHEGNVGYVKRRLVFIDFDPME